uniref:chloroplast envelope membrane protein n=1 Tax=Madagascaria erythrocladioides TaxID=753684 RepID=UPI001BEF1390|nr:chloroplast envelope membrane protein [Madagascaria erythrocladioides]QUE29014.1 CemA [Madagascaria erythrocladioides]UNJ16566.1 chloroplast envelope membrane protein [Madagascaria erythrocladioides]
MKYWNLKKVNKPTVEKLGPIPRSIIKTFEKFKKELDPNAEIEAIEEFRVARYLTVNSIKYLLILILAPVLINQLSKILLFGPFVDYCWNHYQPDMFLNSSQEERAFAELQQFEEKIHFEILIGKINDISYDFAEQQIRIKAVQLAHKYASESADAIKNILSDTFSLGIFIALLVGGKRQISILKSFINEIIYGLSDTAKAFLIILFTDIFVGFHSPHGWEVIIEAILRHFGLPESREFIFLFISTFPVILDTVFKYWIFRYLNRVSPSAVATYHNMNE